jgi:ABC-2 type transport system ATP-binding protein
MSQESRETRRTDGAGPATDADAGPTDAPESRAYAIAGEGIEVTYSDGTEAVRGVDLHVPRGEFFGFLGPNGAGKTTTIKTLATLLDPTGGEVRVNGFDVRTEARKVRESIGYMAQETSVDPELTARENIRFACEAYGVPRAERAERIDELLDLADLADVADKEADEFSGGMKKRLDAATALVHRPPLVFLDEPTTGLDPKARNRLWDYFRRINDQGTTVFLTTQYLEEADQLCDRLSVIADGELVATGSPDELKRRVGGEILDIELAGAEGPAGDPATDGTSDGDPRERAAAVARDADLFADTTVETTAEGISVTAADARAHGTDLLVALRDADIGVTGFNIRAPTLDDVFLAITGEHVDDGTDGEVDG